MLQLPPRCRSLVRHLACALACAALATPAGAVIIDSGDGTGNTTAPGDDPGWDYVGLRAALTAVYLGNGWVVSANHVAAGTLILDGIGYPYVTDSKIQIDDGGGTLGDLAVWQIDPYPAWPLLPISSEASLVGKKVFMIGQGRDRGAAQTACAPPKDGYLWEGSKTKRWGKNVVEAHVNVLNTDSFYATFDESGLTHEAQAADGDSGGGVFVKNGGQWELAGVMFVLASFGCQPTDSAFHGNLTYSSDLAAYRDQILPIVRPECSDELDNDSDSLVDYPNDPECSSEFDDSESPPKVPSVSPVGMALLITLMLGGVAAVRRRCLR